MRAFFLGAPFITLCKYPAAAGWQVSEVICSTSTAKTGWEVVTSKKSLSSDASAAGSREASASCNAAFHASFSAAALAAAARFLRGVWLASVDVSVSSEHVDEASDSSESATDAEAGETGCCSCRERASQFGREGGVRM